MKLIINPNQLQLLTSNYLLTEQGLVENGSDLITEYRMKEYLVKVIVSGLIAQIRVGANNGTNAILIVKKLFPHQARVTGQFIAV